MNCLKTCSLLGPVNVSKKQAAFTFKLDELVLMANDFAGMKWYRKVPDLAARTESSEWYRFLPLDAIAPLFPKSFH
jgi:hypothetical protein